MPTELGSAPRHEPCKFVKMLLMHFGKGPAARLLVQLEFGNFVERPSSTCMATRWHRGDPTAKLGMHCMIGVLRDIPLVLINRTRVTVAIAPSIDLTLHPAAGEGPPFVAPMCLKARSYISPLPVINVIEIDAVPARPTVSWMVR